jgi:uncharacterized surface protein with fasciclin (FAS1) repeats
LIILGLNVLKQESSIMDRTNRLIAAFALVSSALLGTAVMADHHKTGDHSKMAPTKNIVETASAVPDLSTLVAAVTAAGLVDTLASQGPFANQRRL